MTVEKDQETRAKFYSGRPLAKYMMLNGVPSSTHAFRNMVASGSSEDLASEKGLKLISCLSQVAFLRHAQQINIMDKSNGRIIATITR
jgi:hypothetical protein